VTLAKNRAHYQVDIALRNGTLERPSRCEECGRDCFPDAAHFDYSEPLKIRWLCRSCHVRWDNAVPKPEPAHVPPKPRPLIDSPLCREIVRQGRFRNGFAKRLGVRPWTFSRIEAGVQPAPEGWYERAAEVLGVPVDDIRPREEVAA
jgi:hypothetical protein